MENFDFKNKKVLIVGLGLHGGGVGTAKFFARQGARVIVTDIKERKFLLPSLNKLKNFRNIKYVLGRHRTRDFLGADLIIKGPGVPDNSKYIRLAGKAGIPIDTDIGIFFKNCPAPMIGVTGSKGKSTTVTLVAEMLKQKYKKVFLVGNIRKSVLEILPKVNKKTPIVLELSSFQLEGLSRHKISPHIAVITNIFREHLNRYKNLREYALAKANIFKFQDNSDYLLINKDDIYTKKFAKTAKSKIIFFGQSRGKISPPRANLSLAENPALQGRHNMLNVSAAEEVAKLYDIPPALRERAVKDFKGLEGRMQFIASINGVNYYNDTTATMPNAAIAALKTFKQKNNGDIILIAGGSDKRLNFKEFAETIKSNVKHAVFLPGDATEKIKKYIKNQSSFFNSVSMGDAVKLAYNLAKRGDIVILSPGAASFGQFQHEFERGAAFVKEIRKLL